MPQRRGLNVEERGREHAFTDLAPYARQLRAHDAGRQAQPDGNPGRRQPLVRESDRFGLRLRQTMHSDQALMRNASRSLPLILSGMQAAKVRGLFFVTVTVTVDVTVKCSLIVVK